MSDNIIPFPRGRSADAHSLIDSAVSDFRKSSSEVSARQLSFNFGEIHELLLLNPTAFSRELSLGDALDALGSSNLVDMRVSPRFDFFASNRTAAFSYLSAREIGYVDVFGRAGLDSYAEDSESLQLLWLAFMRVLDSIPVAASPIFVLFDDLNIIRHFQSVFLNIADLKIIDEDFLRQAVDSNKKLRM